HLEGVARDDGAFVVVRARVAERKPRDVDGIFRDLHGDPSEQRVLYEALRVEHDLARTTLEVERLADAVTVLAVVLGGAGDEQEVALDGVARVADHRVLVREHPLRRQTWAACRRKFGGPDPVGVPVRARELCAEPARAPLQRVQLTGATARLRRMIEGVAK